MEDIGNRTYKTYRSYKKERGIIQYFLLFTFCVFCGKENEKSLLYQS